jgi:hypothetical protein
MKKDNEGSPLEKENELLLKVAKQQAARIKQLEAANDQLSFDNALMRVELETLRKVVEG